MKAILLFAMALMVLGACKKSDTTFTPDCSGAARTYAHDAAPVLSSSCVSCHSNYGSYAGVNADKSNIRTSIVNGSMPKNSSLTSAQKNAVICWIDAGAANN